MEGERAAEGLKSLTPTTPPRTLGHFEIIERIGLGGMGEVFKARDLRLGRLVALKVLPRDAFQDEIARRRFVQEARLAASITHPRVATVHEIDEENGTPFIAMELVPGQNLKQLLESGPLPVERVLHVGRQVCEALAVAHAHGIIHRDIKSSNIMITPDDQAKVLDFGLAKPFLQNRLSPERPSTGEVSVSSTDGIEESDRSSDPLTRQGIAVGTLNYMSPEQASGRELDPRTDIFSLGVVLYEACCGQLPFRAKTDRELLLAIRNTDPPAPHLSGARVPVELSQVITRCLAKRLEDRYRSAVDLREDLARVQKGASGTRSRFRAATAWLTRKTTLAAALLAAAALWTVRASVSKAPQLPAGSTVVLADLDNRTGDRQLDAVWTLVETDLRQSAHFRVMEQRTAREVLQRMTRPASQRLDPETAHEVAWREGTPLVVAGTLLQIGSTYVLTLSMDRVGKGSPSPIGRFSKSFRARDKDALYDIVDAGSRWIRMTLGETVEEMHERDLPIRETTTPSWQALELYFHAEQMKAEGRDEDAITFLRNAVDIDPDFTKALMRLGDILTSARRYGEAHRYWGRAQESMKRRALTRRERLHFTALYANDMGDFIAAEKAFRTYSLFYPGEYYPLVGHAITLRKLGRLDDAIAKFLEAEKRDPSDFRVPSNLAITELLLKHFDRAEQHINRVRSLGANDWADFLEGLSLFLRRSFDDALRYSAGLTQSHDVVWQSRGIAFHARLLAEFGRYNEAIRILEEGAELDRQNGDATAQADKLLNLAYLRYRKGDLDACRSLCLEATHLGEVDQALPAGILLARAGFAEEARALLPLFEGHDTPRFRIAREKLSGEILLSKGQKAEALKHFVQAAVLEPPSVPQEYLARGLTFIGKSSEALPLYRRTKDSQGHFTIAFLGAGAELFPGQWADALWSYARLCWSLNLHDESREALSLYLELRARADADLHEVSEARKLERVLR